MTKYNFSINLLLNVFFTRFLLVRCHKDKEHQKNTEKDWYLKFTYILKLTYQPIYDILFWSYLFVISTLIWIFIYLQYDVFDATKWRKRWNEIEARRCDVVLTMTGISFPNLVSGDPAEVKSFSLTLPHLMIHCSAQQREDFIRKWC